MNNGIVKHGMEWNNETRQCECKNYRKCEEDYNWNPNTCICENSSYLNSIADTSVSECDEVVIIMDNLSTKKANTTATKKTNIIATNVTITALINCLCKKVRYYYISHTVLLVIILL